MAEETSQRLEGQVVLVTGSSSGIGAAIARRVSSEGAKVVVNSRSSTEAGEAVAATLEDGFYVRGDVSVEEDRHRIVSRTVERFGRLDHLVNNAGTTAVIPHEDLDAVGDELFQRILDVNLLGTWNLTRAALPHLREHRGSVLNVTSIAGIRPVGSSIPYAVSKAALNHLTLLLAKVVGPVRVNALAPGLIETPWTADWTAQHESVARTAPVGRSGTAEDMAEAAMGLLLSPYTTGHVLVADGGLTLEV